MKEHQKNSLLELITDVQQLLSESQKQIHDGLFPPRNADNTVADRDFDSIGKGTGKALVASGKVDALTILLEVWASEAKEDLEDLKAIQETENYAVAMEVEWPEKTF